MTKVSEVKYLLRFFAQSQDDQWAQLPSTIAPICVDVGENYFPTEKSLEVLMVIFHWHLCRCPEEFADAYEILGDLRAVLY